MQKITAEQVVEAYEKTGLIPVRQMWFTASEDTSSTEACGCAMTAICIADNPVEFYKSLKEDAPDIHNAGKSDRPFYHAIGKITGLPHPYVKGFIRGFDSFRFFHDIKGEEEKAMAEQGYLDGVAAYKAVKERFGSIVKEGLDEEDHS